MLENETNIILQGKIFKVKVCACCGYKFFGAIEKKCPGCGKTIKYIKVA